MKYLDLKLPKALRPTLLVAALALLVACGGTNDFAKVGTTGGGAGGGPTAAGFVDGTDVPLTATTSSNGATAFANSLVTAGTSETAEPLVLGDAVLATSDTDEADVSI